MYLPPKPSSVSNIEFIRNLTPYVFAARLVKGKSVLEIGCGTGHGAWLMAAHGARSIVVLDLDPAKIERALQMCAPFQNCHGFVMDAQELRLDARNYQVVNCYEVIEHVPDPRNLLLSIRRTMAEDGVLLMTTPNRSVRLFPWQRPRNPEHMREYSVSRFEHLLRKHFPFVTVLGIYADSKVYSFYRSLWRPTILRPLLGALIPSSAKQWIKNRLSYYGPPAVTHWSRTTANLPVPAPEPEVWPFFPRQAVTDCLNPLGVCSLDGKALEEVVRTMMS